MKVYAALFPNGKKYIGVTTREIEARVQDHKDAMNRVDNKFYRALKKHGIENVEFRHVKDCKTVDEMFVVEKVLIERHKTNTDGYNSTTGGEGNPGRIVREETRRKISELQKKRFENPEERQKAAITRAKWNEENPEKAEQNKQKMLDVLRSDEQRKKASEKQLAFVKANPEHPKLHGEKLRQRYAEDPDLRARISSSLGGKPVEIFKDGEKVHEFVSVIECSQKLHLNHGNLRMVLKGKRNHVKGFVAKYKE